MLEYCRAAGLSLIARIRLVNTAMIRLAQRCGMDVERRPENDLAIAHIGAHPAAAVGNGIAP
jgi:hypothetical protein